YDRAVTTGADLLIWNARLVDGGGRPPRDRVSSEIPDGLIPPLVDLGGGSPPRDALDVGGRTIMPGLIDAHVHVVSDLERSPGFGPPPALHGEEPRPEAPRWFILARA